MILGIVTDEVKEMIPVFLKQWIKACVCHNAAIYILMYVYNEVFYIIQAMLECPLIVTAQ